MKKICFAIIAAASLLAACTDNYKIDAPAGEDSAIVTTFVGSAAETKISVGDKTGTKYTLLWNEGDVLKIVDASSSAELGTATLSSGAGSNEGTFTTTADIADGTSVKLVYGAAAIPAEQTRATSADKSLDGFTYAESEPVSFAKGGNVSFVLTHTPAILKVSVSSSDFAAMKLNRVVVYSKDAVLAGTDSDYAQLTFTTPAALSGTQEAWIAVKPVSAASDFWVAAELTGTYNGIDGSTVTIPLKFEGKTLQGGKVTAIDLTGLTLSKNALSWYNPVCTRYIPIDGWCYGEANTILVDPAANSSVTFDVRAVGNFLNVIKYAQEPKSFKCRIADQVNTGTWTSWKIDGTTSSNAGVVALKSLAPTIGRSDKAIANSKTAVCGFFDVLDASGNVIWAYSLWASSVSSHTYKCGVDVMDQTLGAENPVSVGSTSAKARNRGTYYQWGRPFPFGYGDALQLKDKKAYITSLAESAANANYIAAIHGSATSSDWFTPDVKGDHHNDLWGNPSTDNTSTGGTKSIFDPCPKGWMVCCPAVLQEVAEKGSLVSTPTPGISYNVDGTWSDFYSGGAFRYVNDTDGHKRGSDKGLFISNIGNSNENAFNMEIAADGSSVKFPSTWRANACSVRCMKDTSSR